MSKEIKITKECLQRAYDEGCEDVKKVIKTLCPDEFEKKIEYDKCKIYAIKNHVVCFLCEQTDDNYVWMPISNTDGRHAYNGYKSRSGEKAIAYIKDIEAIEVFDSQKDFLTWALKQVS